MLKPLLAFVLLATDVPAFAMQEPPVNPSGAPVPQAEYNALDADYNAVIKKAAGNPALVGKPASLATDFQDAYLKVQNSKLDYKEWLTRKGVYQDRRADICNLIGCSVYR